MYSGYIISNFCRFFYINEEFDDMIGFFTCLISLIEKISGSFKSFNFGRLFDKTSGRIYFYVADGGEILVFSRVFLNEREFASSRKFSSILYQKMTWSNQKS